MGFRTAICALASLVVLAPPALKAALVAELGMNGDNGSTAFIDTVGGTWIPIGTAQISTAQGVSGGASAYFAGDGFVRNTDANALLLTAPFTVEFWMYVNEVPVAGQQYLAGRSIPDLGLGFDIRLEQGEILVLGVNGWGFNIGTEGDGGTNYVEAGQWGHVALSVTETNAYLFYNGVLRGSSGSSTITNGGIFSIGFQSSYGGAPFQGYIDDFRVWDTALWTADFNPSGGEVPEPGTWILVAGGMALALYRRRLPSSSR
jgi:hypothetical protein